MRAAHGRERLEVEDLRADVDVDAVEAEVADRREPRTRRGPGRGAGRTSSPSAGGHRLVGVGRTPGLTRISTLLLARARPLQASMSSKLSIDDVPAPALDRGRELLLASWRCRGRPRPGRRPRRGRASSSPPPATSTPSPPRPYRYTRGAGERLRREGGLGVRPGAVRPSRKTGTGGHRRPSSTISAGVPYVSASSSTGNRRSPTRPSRPAGLPEGTAPARDRPRVLRRRPGAILRRDRRDRQAEPFAFEGRSSCSQRDTRFGSVEMMISSNPWRFTASWIALSGSGSPTMPSTWRAGGLLEQRQRQVEHRLGLVVLLVLGVDDAVQAVGGVGHEQRERARAAGGALAHRLHQRRRRGRAVGDHQDPLSGSWRTPWLELLSAKANSRRAPNVTARRFVQRRATHADPADRPARRATLVTGETTNTFASTARAPGCGSAGAPL